MGWFRQLCCGGLALTFAVPALAEETAKAPTKSESKKETAKEQAKETVTVAGTRPSVQVLADRTVYSLDKNIQSSTSSISDILRNLPSLDVDIDGNVSLRGDQNVTILIDGKKSPLLAGNKADALQQIPASMIERVEVITNPSAEFRAEGSAGIINIVLRKDRELVSSGIVRVNVGDRGRLNASATGNVKLGPVHLNGGYGERRDGRRSVSSVVRTDGTNTTSSQAMTGRSAYSGRWTYLAATADAGKDEFQLSGNYGAWAGHYGSTENNIAAGSDMLRDGYSTWGSENAGGEAGYRHKFADKDESFHLDLSHYISWSRSGSDYTNLVGGTPDYWQRRRSRGHETHTGLEADYELPLGEKGKFKTGYALQIDTNLTDALGLWRDPTLSDWASDNGFTNLFALDRSVHAGYLSYEQKFGAFGVKAGLRLEQDFLHTDLKTTGEVHDTKALGLYPSLHLSYALTDTNLVTLSYSRRLNRPQLDSLNPARYSNDAFSVWAGNPLLQNEAVDAYETSYHHIGETSDVMVTGFYRATYHGFANVYRYLSSTVLLTTTDNLAHRMASGVEANVNATLLPGLNLKSSGALSYSEFNPGAQGIGTKQSGMNWNIKGGFEWQPLPEDSLQLNINYAGKQRFSQGYTNPTLSGDLGLRHRFEGGFAAVVSVNNLFDSWDRGMVLDSPGLHQVSNRSNPGRVFYFGLVYTFGGAKDVEPASGGAQGGMGPGGGQ
ncbi:outer membrane receptor protein involved in Fe transport [Rhizomicrobium palustre]|uniref:Outer membrane receptor protein involved in Fe transport n=1 Tax=Rhizomicrobium palustre TaxID=189966 RepID=A0A846MW02_9PROT|nr:outer membrane beta-barrel family protein [Rhizomicrobium palustre]NIK87533.1 outer membrane receptor protein involved in Fe transport [Rhizomicrobium palustre]